MEVGQRGNYGCSPGEQMYRADNGGGEMLLIMLRRGTNERTGFPPWQIEGAVNDKSSKGKVADRIMLLQLHIIISVCAHVCVSMCVYCQCWH